MASRLEPIGGPAAWSGGRFDWRARALHGLTAAELDDIDAALRHLRALGPLDFPDIGRAQFPLARLSATLDRLRHELTEGSGVVLLRGLPRERYDVDDMARILYGLGVHVGVPGPQSHQGELLGNVIDVSDIEAEPRGYHKGGRQNFHNDSADVVALMCLRRAREGGASRLASAVAIHDALVDRRPDLAAALYRGMRYRRMELDARFGTGLAVSRDRMAIFERVGERFSSYFLASYARAAVAGGDGAATEAELEALDEVERLAGSEEFCLDMNVDEGDIQFLNNRLILHSRLGYEDFPELPRRRHMLRLWLSMPDWPAMPQRQVLHSAEDRRLWLRRRRPLMEFPSRYLQEMANQQAERVLKTVAPEVGAK